MRFSILVLIVLLGCTSAPQTPSGSYLGLLKFPEITYHIYIEWNGPQPLVINTTFKANQFSLDTLYFKDDSLHFRLSDFYSEYKGKFNTSLNRIEGQWIGEDSTHYPLDFIPVMADTVSGLTPRITTAYSYQPPLQHEDGIIVCNRGSENFNSHAIDTLIQRIINKRYINVHSLLIARNNCLVVEEYFYRYNLNFVYNIQSATKSIVSALTGIAIDKGEIKSVNETLCKTLPGYEALACNAQNKDLTLRELLTMSTGIAWDEQTYDYTDERNTLAIAANEKDQFVHLLSLPRKKMDMPVFTYNSLNHSLMNAVLRNATHLENKQELTERLLRPLGIEKCYIDEPSPMGTIGDIGLRPRDMLKFGLVYLNEGVWNGKQVVPAHWVRESTSTKIHPTATFGYGYFWWTKVFNWKGKPIQSFFAWGYGDQYIFVVPDAELVVVMSGSNWTTNPDGQAIQMVEEVLAAME
jgi:CubicO group peptidase (beta-lactamase class C family)